MTLVPQNQNYGGLTAQPFVQEDDRVDTYGTDHFHWGITAFSYFNDQTGELKDSIQIEVEAKSEQQALNRAMQIVQRPYYRVSWVREACTSDKTIDD